MSQYSYKTRVVKGRTRWRLEKGGGGIVQWALFILGQYLLLIF